MEIAGKLAQANGRLKAANVGVKIEQKGDRLYLRATLPPKPGSSLTQVHQQRISLGVRANPAGLKDAEAEARKVGALLACREFDWLPYLAPGGDEATCGDLIEQMGRRYLLQGGTETTWNGDYLKVFKTLPQEKVLTGTIAESAILRTQPNTRTRKRYCMAIKKLCQFAGIDYNPSHLAGSYSALKVEPRDLPTDEAIAAAIANIPMESWRWFYGMVATYGLRPHEVFHLDLEPGNDWEIIKVKEGTKTGRRMVWPFYPEWVEQFNLRSIALPAIKLDRTNEQIGRACTHYFWKKIPFNLYDLRHAWAVRTLEFGLDLTLAAQQMGHSVQIHSTLYHHWVSKDVHQRAFTTLMANPNRPKPPTI